MASKNMTTIMALYLTFNLVLLGFTSAQPPVPTPVCPLAQRDLGVCIDVLNPVRVGNVEACCNLLGGLEGPDAAVCACDIVRLSLLNGVIGVTLTQVLRLCPGLSVPIGFLCNQ